MARQLQAGGYEFQPLRAVAIPKPNGGHRLLAIPTVADRVVQKAMLTVVSPHIKHWVNSPGSHAYLSQKGLATAVNDVKRHIKAGNRSIVQTDIVKFFDKLSAADAVERLLAELPDDSLRPLLAQYVGWEVTSMRTLPREVRKCFPAGGLTTGLPQGTALAPILANLMLGDIDRDAKAKGFAVVRYADDIIFLAPSTQLALDAFDWYEARLATLHLTVHDPRTGGDKARLIADVASGVEYLGCFIKSEGRQIKVRPQESKIHEITRRLNDALTARGRASFPQRIIVATQTAEAWIGSYRSLCGMSRVSKRISDSMANAIEKLLHQRGILAPGRKLDSQQRAFLGFQLIGTKRRSRQTRAHVRLQAPKARKAR